MSHLFESGSISLRKPGKSVLTGNKVVIKLNILKQLSFNPYFGSAAAKRFVSIVKHFGDTWNSF